MHIVLRLVLFTTAALAQQQHRTIWGTVIYNRAGEAEPDLSNVQALTSVGAQQSYQAGQFFRERYISSGTTNISGLNPDLISLIETYVLALDTAASVASAQAFMQGFYPPYSLKNNASSASGIDPTAITSTGSYVEGPLNGYQYPSIHVAGALDPDYIFIGGNLLCDSFEQSVNMVANTADYQSVKNSSMSVYQKFTQMMNGILSSTQLNFDNAYPIYNYISYLAEHNSTISALLQSPSYIDPNTHQSYLYTLQYLADRYEQFTLTNQSALNSVTGAQTLPWTAGSISTIAGNMFAGKVLTHLSGNKVSYGANYKLSVLFGGFEPLVSLFSLMSMGTKAGSNFTGIPEYASAAVFELYSNETSLTPSYPKEQNLRVSFSFRNGSGTGVGFSTPMTLDYEWNDFVDTFMYYYLGDVGEWCTQCGAARLFCAAYNSSLLDTSFTSIPAASTASGHSLSPVIAGVIGAIVTLAIATIICALVMLLGGIRFHRRPRKGSRNADLGGFKGSAKLASDQDLTLPKTGVTVGTDELSSGQTHERMGSWEMKSAAKENAQLSRHSFEDDHVEHAKPVEVSERV